MNKFILRAAALASFAIGFAGCGVRGKPLPPESAPDIGRGRPTFRRATEDLAFPQVPPVESVPESAPSAPARREDGP